MAEYTVKMADERGHVLEQMEHGGSEVEVRDRFAQQGYLVYSVKSSGLFWRARSGCRAAARSSRSSSSSSISSL